MREGDHTAPHFLETRDGSLKQSWPAARSCALSGHIRTFRILADLSAHQLPDWLADVHQDHLSDLQAFANCIEHDIATAPTSLLLLTLPGVSATLTAPVVLGALLNAALIGWCARTLRRGRHRDLGA